MNLNNYSNYVLLKSVRCKKKLSGIIVGCFGATKQPFMNQILETTKQSSSNDTLATT